MLPLIETKPVSPNAVTASEGIFTLKREENPSGSSIREIITNNSVNF